MFASHNILTHVDKHKLNPFDFSGLSDDRLIVDTIILNNNTAYSLLFNGCESGDIVMVKLIYSIHKCDYILKNTCAFVFSCERKHYEISKCIYNNYNKKRIDVIHQICCTNGYIEMIKWFAELGIDIHHICGESFHVCCRYGHIETAKFLVELGIDTHMYDELAFKRCCQYKQFEIADWLISLGGIPLNIIHQHRYELNLGQAL